MAVAQLLKQGAGQNQDPFPGPAVNNQGCDDDWRPARHGRQRHGSTGYVLETAGVERDDPGAESVPATPGRQQRVVVGTCPSSRERPTGAVEENTATLRARIQSERRGVVNIAYCTLSREKMSRGAAKIARRMSRRESRRSGAGLMEWAAHPAREDADRSPGPRCRGGLAKRLEKRLARGPARTRVGMQRPGQHRAFGVA